MINEKSVPVGENTIGVKEQRDLIDFSRNLGRALNKEEYKQIVMVFKGVIDRLCENAKKEGIEI